MGGRLCGLCQEEPKHVEAFNKVGLRRCYICINKTGATGDNVDTAEESTIALRKRGHKQDSARAPEIFLDHKVKKRSTGHQREREREKKKKDFLKDFLIPSGAPSGSPSNDIL